MKTMIKTTIVAVTLLVGATAAQAAYTGAYSGYPGWAQGAFESNGN